MDPMEPVIQGIFFLIAVVLAIVASLPVVTRVALHPLALAFFVVPFCWNAFAAA